MGDKVRWEFDQLQPMIRTGLRLHLPDQGTFAQLTLVDSKTMPTGVIVGRFTPTAG